MRTHTSTVAVKIRVYLTGDEQPVETVDLIINPEVKTTKLVTGFHVAQEHGGENGDEDIYLGCYDPVAGRWLPRFEERLTHLPLIRQQIDWPRVFASVAFWVAPYSQAALAA